MVPMNYDDEHNQNQQLDSTTDKLNKANLKTKLQGTMGDRTAEN
jgi:hypothetical protein